MCKQHPVTIPNSVSWSPDRTTLYFTNSTERQILAFPYDPRTGHVDTTTTSSSSSPTVLYHHPGPGEPDGCRVDVDGYLWQAVYGEGRVLKISPRGQGQGQVVGEIRLPTRNVTCTQFVGTELLITTAAMEEGEGTEEEVRMGGALFRVDVGVKGLEPFLFKLGGS